MKLGRLLEDFRHGCAQAWVGFRNGPTDWDKFLPAEDLANAEAQQDSWEPDELWRNAPRGPYGAGLPHAAPGPYSWLGVDEPDSCAAPVSPPSQSVSQAAGAAPTSPAAPEAAAMRDNSAAGSSSAQGLPAAEFPNPAIDPLNVVFDALASTVASTFRDFADLLDPPDSSPTPDTPSPGGVGDLRNIACTIAHYYQLDVFGTEALLARIPADAVEQLYQHTQK